LNKFIFLLFFLWCDKVSKICTQRTVIVFACQHLNNKRFAFLFYFAKIKSPPVELMGIDGVSWGGNNVRRYAIAFCLPQAGFYSIEKADDTSALTNYLFQI
jgi:hypothetical protein